MVRSEAKPLTARRPLRDVANIIGGGRVEKSVTKKFAAEKDKEEGSRFRARQEDEGEEDESLDRLLLVQSDLSALVRQVDALVAEAFKSKLASKQWRKEVDSFANVLSDMLSSMKPWVPRFQKLLPSQSTETESQQLKTSIREVETIAPNSPEENNTNFLISPSPLVSWRANCTTESGRQLFLLTPLPISKGLLSSKHQEPPKSVFERVTSSKKLVPFNLPASSKPSDLTAIESTPLTDSKSRHSVIVMTPCLNRSPLKTCVLLESISESSGGNQAQARKGTPFPVGFKCSDSDMSESSSGNDVSADLALKYPELMGIQNAYKSVATKKHVEDSPDWFRSPPKSCVLLELPNEKTLLNDAKDADTRGVSRVVKTIRQQEIGWNYCFIELGDFSRCKKNMGPASAVDYNLEPENTPIWKEPQSTCRKGRKPGENTLKKELWTRFEAASINGLRLDGGSSQRGFLNLLDEVSCDGEI